ncbi:hypothetical protein HUK65_06030 [Rhodobacteraceae bacterium 2376]|uniref:Uncharacterized protein n=1 Tax=Rhabdonatronobacter sediminivivens TaxID=2743469 RepID=A0A7Z0KYJ6_9RHOB|nr:dockerin type I domain-containing protein [Rhabdonatronobacter sediminivivens]NYS24546.1 hypothetical protein [Rhabdonatronobacter sediminivivens]
MPVNVTLNASQDIAPALTALDHGGFAVAWQAGHGGMMTMYGAASSSFSQPFIATGQPIAQASRIMDWSTGHVSDTVPLTDGQYLAILAANPQHPEAPDQYNTVLGQIIDATGAPLGEPFLVPQSHDSHKNSPAAALLDDGSIVVAWVEAGVHAQATFWRRFDAEGNPLNDEQPLLPLGRIDLDVDVAAMPDGGFLLLVANHPGWGQSVGINSAQRFDAEGNAVGELSRAVRAWEDLGMSFLHGNATIVPLPDGPMVGVWTATATVGYVTNVLALPFAADLLGTDGDDELQAGDVGTAIFGFEGNDTLIGGPGNDFLTGGPGDDLLFGGGGMNTAVFSGVFRDYDIAHGPQDTLVVTDQREGSPDGTDTLSDIHMLKFTHVSSPSTTEVADLDLDLTVAGHVSDMAGNAMANVDVTFTAAADGWEMQTTRTGPDSAFDLRVAKGLAGELAASRDHDPATDGRPSAMDALEVLRMAVGLDPSFGPAQALNFIAADVNGDGQITALDALEVLRAAVGLASDNAPRWVFVDSATDWEALDLSRSNVQFDTGITIAAGDSDLDLGLTGILLGNMAEVA